MAIVSPSVFFLSISFPKTLHLPLTQHGPLIQEPISYLFLTTSTLSSSSSSSPIRASSQSPSSSWPELPHETIKNPNPHSTKPSSPSSESPLPTIASTAMASFLLSRIRFDPETLVAPVPTQELNRESSGFVITRFDLKKKLKVVDFVIEVKPADQAWHLLKTQICSYSQELKFATDGFQEIVATDLLCHKAYYNDIRECLEMACELMDWSKEIEAAMDKCADNDISTFSFQELHKQNVTGKVDEKGTNTEWGPRKKLSFDTIRESLQHLRPSSRALQNERCGDLLSLSKYKSSLKLKPLMDSSPVIGGTDTLSVSVFGKEMERKRRRARQWRFDFFITFILHGVI
ncbi:hypothetical protein CJ030_MR5G009728 [Morella rubra]|uniref:Uncharacterized protein n=1 Tax=Morella rubra TaxID=262757 RepID=A0A6A1VLE5_9ROSI|nr:hypothetical protein CJ030_MR5G009728 [Morella rubra]